MQGWWNGWQPGALTCEGQAGLTDERYGPVEGGHRARAVGAGMTLHTQGDLWVGSIHPAEDYF